MIVKKGLAVIATVLFLLLTGGCAQNAPQYRLYTLKASSQNMTNPMSFTLGVAPVEVPGWLDQTSLVWSDGEVQLDKQEYDRWAEPIRDAMTRVLTQDFSQYYGGGRVVPGPWNRSERPERVVKVTVLSLGRVQNQLVMDVHWEVSDPEKKILISQYQTYFQSLSETGSAAEYVQALSQLLYVISTDVAVNLERLVTE